MKSVADELLNKIMDYDSIIFDLDDTIYPQYIYDEAVYVEMEKALVKAGCDASGVGDYLACKRKEKGSGYKFLFDDAINYLGVDNFTVGDFIDIYLDVNPDIEISNNLIAINHDQLKDKKIFIVTNGHRSVQERKLSKISGIDCVDLAIVCDAKKPEQLKPNLWAFEEIKSKFDIGRVLFIGDNIGVDGQFASRAGIDFLHYEFSYEDWK